MVGRLVGNILREAASLERSRAPDARPGNAGAAAWKAIGSRPSDSEALAEL